MVAHTKTIAEKLYRWYFGFGSARPAQFWEWSSKNSRGKSCLLVPCLLALPLPCGRCVSSLATSAYSVSSSLSLLSHVDYSLYKQQTRTTTTTTTANQYPVFQNPPCAFIETFVGVPNMSDGSLDTILSPSHRSFFHSSSSRSCALLEVRRCSKYV